jgi:inosine-uridine nucleoside N-ribohydrolase
VNARTPSLRRRVIIDTDAKNEADDQFAIVHALLTPMFDVRGLIATHFGRRRGPNSMLESRAEIDLLLKHLGSTVRVENGAPHALPDFRTPVRSSGAELIIEEAMREDAGPLFVAVLGPLTDMADALLMEPRIAWRDMTVVWIGGAPYDEQPPARVPEFNLSNDIAAADVVFGSKLDVWQVPMSTYMQTSVGYAELEEKVGPCGELGAYLVRQLVEFNERYVSVPMEHRALGDSPAISLMMNPYGGGFTERPAPGFRVDGSYDFDVTRRPIRVYHSIDTRFLFEDLFAKLRRFARG